MNSLGTGGIGWRLAATVAVVYTLHFATNVVRETYPAVTLGDHFSFQVDEYLGLHPDLFQIEGRGAYINNNPGASIMGAVPYTLARPVIALVFRVRPGLAEPKPPAIYDDPRPNRTRFMNEARARGVDIKLGLAAASMHVGLMVPLAIIATLVMFRLLSARLADRKVALWLALLYAFGTPIFFRSGFLNQNAILAHCVLFAYVALTGWGRTPTQPTPARFAAAGLFLGLGLLNDYSAGPVVLVFGIWTLVLGWQADRVRGSLAAGTKLLAGAAGPLLVLWGYQWAAFGNPFLPAQTYMPSTSLSHDGWHGFVLPQPDLLWNNLFSWQFGLFAFCPLLLLAFAAPFIDRNRVGPTKQELALLLAAAGALYLFASSVAFARLQWNTGVRYLVPAVPLLFIALVPVLLAMPRWLVAVAVLPTVAISWSLAMVRESVPISLAHVFLGGFELPWLTVLGKMASGYAPALRNGTSPMAFFVLAGVVLWVVWRGFGRTTPTAPGETT